MLKKGMLGAAFALLVAGAGAFAQKQQVMLDKVVAVVGSSSILHSEVAEYARQLTAQRRAEGYTSDRDPMNEALEALMTQKLLFNQAQIDSVKINAGDIATHVEQQIQNMIETEGSIPKLEAKHHMAIFSIRENMRQRYEEQSYASSMQSEVVSKVSVIPGEVERFYKSIDKDSLPTVAEQSTPRSPVSPSRSPRPSSARASACSTCANGSLPARRNSRTWHACIRRIPGR